MPLAGLAAWWGAARGRARGVGRWGRRVGRHPPAPLYCWADFFLPKGGYWEGLMGCVPLLRPPLPSFLSLPFWCILGGVGGEPDAWRRPAWPCRPTRPFASDRCVGTAARAVGEQRPALWSDCRRGSARPPPVRAPSVASARSPSTRIGGGDGGDGVGQRRRQRRRRTAWLGSAPSRRVLATAGNRCGGPPRGHVRRGEGDGRG